MKVLKLRANTLVSKILHQNLQQRRSIENGLRFLEEFCDSTSIHGLSFLVRRNRHWLEFIFWLSVIVSVISVSIYLSVDLIEQYKRENVVITIDIDSKKFESTRPSFTFCPQYELSDLKIDTYIREHNVGADVSREDLKYFLQQLTRMTIATIKPMKELNYGISPNDYMELVFNITDEIRTNNFVKYAAKTMTDVGLCYTNHNFLIQNGTSSIHWGDHTKDTYFRKTVQDFKKYSTFDRNDGITLIYYGHLTVYIHSPYEMPTTWTRPVRDSSPKQSLLMQYATTDITFDNELISGTTTEQRRCRSDQESNLRMFPKTYSRSLCLMDCRAQFATRQCNCLPHFYGKIEFRKAYPMKICDVKGLNCLANYTGILRNLESSKDGVLKCSCLPNCSLMDIKTQLISKRFQFDPGNQIFLFDVHQLNSPKIQYNRTIVLTDLDFAVAIGNVLGVFLGCCFLSFVELVYFFSLRIFWFRRGYRGAVQWLRN